MSINAVLEKLGIDYKEVKNGEELLFKCVNPNHDDTKPSASINASTGKWRCFSCGVGGDLEKFIKMATGKEASVEDLIPTESSAKLKIKNLYKKSVENITEYEAFSQYQKRLKIAFYDFIPALDNEKSNKYLKAKRHLTDKTINHFGLMYATEGEYENRVIIPYKSGNTTIGINTRHIGTSKLRYKYFIDKNSMKGFLYNYENVEDFEYCILVEGPFDLMYLHQCGFKNVISPLSTNLNVEKIEKVIKFKKIIFCFDNDVKSKAGENAVFNHSEKILKMFPEKIIYTVNLPEGKDPNDCSLSELNTVFKKLKRIKPKQSTSKLFDIRRKIIARAGS